MSPLRSITRWKNINRYQAIRLFWNSILTGVFYFSAFIVLLVIADKIKKVTFDPRTFSNPARDIINLFEVSGGIMYYVSCFYFFLGAIYFIIQLVRSGRKQFDITDITGLQVRPGQTTIDHEDLGKSLFGLWLLLCVGAVAGVLICAFLIGLFAFGGAMMVAGPMAILALPLAAAAAGTTMLTTMSIGAVAVPAWGTLLGLIGLGGSREFALKEAGGATVSDPNHHLVKDVAELSGRLGLPHVPMAATMPVANAFAIGNDLPTSIVAIGTPLMESLTPGQVRAVIGHELGHLASRDSARLYYAECFQNSLVWFLGFRGLKMFARRILLLVGELTILGISRRREYWADAVGAVLTSKEDMIGALKALDSLDAPPATAERSLRTLMFRDRFALRSLFSTHPSTEDRIVALARDDYIKLLPIRSTATVSEPQPGLSWDDLPSGAAPLASTSGQNSPETLTKPAAVLAYNVVATGYDLHRKARSFAWRREEVRSGTDAPAEQAFRTPDWRAQRQAGQAWLRQRKLAFNGGSSSSSSAADSSASPESSFSMPDWRALRQKIQVWPRQQKLFAGSIAGVLALLVLVLATSRPSPDQMAQLVADREAAVQQRETAATTREGSLATREQQLASREAAVSRRTQELLSREQAFENLRRNPGPEITRLEQLRNESAQERQQLDQARMASQQAASLAVNERQELERNRRDRETEIVRLNEARRQATALQQSFDASKSVAQAEIARLEQARTQTRTEQQQLDQARVSSQQAANLAVSERLALERERSAWNSEFARIDDAKRQISTQQQDLARQRADIARDRQQLDQARTALTSQEQRTLPSSTSSTAAVGGATQFIHGAIAARNGRAWFSWDHSSANFADKIAREQCEASKEPGICEVFLFNRACASMATSISSIQGIGIADSRSNATRAAIINCTNRGGVQCSAISTNTVCSGL